jgi:hypothetical protein
MRQVFTSPRLENVERVASLLHEQGIEARITNGRSFRGSRRSTFSYREAGNEGPQPAVWVVKSEDQPKARELLREIGLLDSGRSPTSYLSTSSVDRLGDDAAGDAAKRRAFRIKSALLLGIAFALGMGLLSLRKPAAVKPATDTAPAAAATPLPSATIASSNGPSSMQGSADKVYRIQTPTALATMLIGAELQAHEDASVCLSVDGADPSQAVLAQLPSADRARVRTQSQCATDANSASAVAVQVGEYRTDGSGVGTVKITVADHAADGRRREQIRTLEVQRDDLQWKIRRVML